MESVKVPRIGETQKIIIPSRLLNHNPEVVEGIYLGEKPVKTPWFQKLESPEGHIFFREVNGKQKIYCYRARDLKITYWCDGFSEPPYLVGIRVERVEEVKLNKLELEFVKGRILKYQKVA